MVRLSKQTRRRNVSFRKTRNVSTKKTGPLKDALPKGYKEHKNALVQDEAGLAFIPVMK